MAGVLRRSPASQVAAVGHAQLLHCPVDVDSTVRTDTTSRSAISAFVSPRAASATSCASRAVRRSSTARPRPGAAALLRQKTGIDIQHVPYRGGGSAVNDLLGGHIGMAFLSLSAVVPHLNTGKVRMIAMVEQTRYSAMPDVPTIGETVPGFEMSLLFWHFCAGLARPPT